MAEQVWFRGEGGVLQVCDVPVPEGIQHRMDRGDLLRVNPDGSTWMGETEPGPENEGLPDGAPPLPKRSASRGVWQQFAISQGMDREKAAGMARDELVAEFIRQRSEG